VGITFIHRVNQNAVDTLASWKSPHQRNVFIARMRWPSVIIKYRISARSFCSIPRSIAWNKASARFVFPPALIFWQAASDVLVAESLKV
jgi:hypothetical protein